MNLSTQLRTILLLVGVVLLFGIYWVGRRKSAAQRNNKAFLNSQRDTHAYPGFNAADKASDEAVAEQPSVLHHIDDDTYEMEDERHSNWNRTHDAITASNDVDEASELAPMYAQPQAAASSWGITSTLEASAPLPSVDDSPVEHSAANEHGHVAQSREAAAAGRVEPSFGSDSPDAESIAPAPDTFSIGTQHEAPAASEAAIPTIDESMVTSAQHARPTTRPASNAAPTLSDAVPVSPATSKRSEEPARSSGASAQPSHKPNDRPAAKSAAFGCRYAGCKRRAVIEFAAWREFAAWQVQYFPSHARRRIGL
jgi:hypothetical protein